MSDAEEIRDRFDSVRAELRTIHGVRSRDMSQAARRARRLVPRDVRRDLDTLADVERQMGHPKLELQADLGAVRAAQSRIEGHLGSIDLKDRRRGRILSLAGVVVFNTLVLAGLFIGWLVLTGQV